jgi:hypothetical protein
MYWSWAKRSVGEAAEGTLTVAGGATRATPWRSMPYIKSPHLDCAASRHSSLNRMYEQHTIKILVVTLVFLFLLRGSLVPLAAVAKRALLSYKPRLTLVTDAQNER